MRHHEVVNLSVTQHICGYKSTSVQELYFLRNFFASEKNISSGPSSNYQCPRFLSQQTWISGACTMSNQAQSDRGLSSIFKATPAIASRLDHLSLEPTAIHEQDQKPRELFPVIPFRPRRMNPPHELFPPAELNTRPRHLNTLVRPGLRYADTKISFKDEIRGRYPNIIESRISNNPSHATVPGQQSVVLPGRILRDFKNNHARVNHIKRFAPRSGGIVKLLPSPRRALFRPGHIRDNLAHPDVFKANRDIFQAKRRGQMRPAFRPRRNKGTLFGEEYDNHFQLKFFTFKAMNQTITDSVSASPSKSPTKQVENPLSHHAKERIVTELNQCLADRANDILRVMMSAAPVTLGRSVHHSSIDLSNASDFLFLALQKRILDCGPGKKQDIGPCLPALTGDEIDYVARGTAQLFGYERHQILSMLRGAVPVVKYGIQMNEDIRAWLPTIPLNVQHVLLKWMRKREEDMDFELRDFARAVEKAVQESSDDEGEVATAHRHLTPSLENIE